MIQEDNTLSEEDYHPSSRFGGDMSRNEVEMDLSKFMDMLQEIASLKDRKIILVSSGAIAIGKRLLNIEKINSIEESQKYLD